MKQEKMKLFAKQRKRKAIMGLLKAKELLKEKFYRFLLVYYKIFF
jgi:hypothetical protein